MIQGQKRFTKLLLGVGKKISFGFIFAHFFPCSSFKRTEYNIHSFISTDLCWEGAGRIQFAA